MADYLRESGVKWIWEKIKTLLSAKQDKLVSGTNIKTINGTSLLGSGNIAISGDSTGNVDEGRLVWSDNYAPTGTLLDNIMKISGNNVLAFMPPSAITIEYSTDNGVTWLDYGWNNDYKTALVTPEFGANGLFLGKSSSSLSTNNRLRITYDFIAANMRFTPSKAGIYFSGVNNSDSFYTKLLIEKYNNYNNDVWEELANQKITTGGWGTFRLPTSDWGYKGSTYRARFRCEFYRTADSVNRTVIGNMIIMATNIVTANSYAKNHRLYTFDYQQNATFPAQVKATKFISNGGKSTQVVKGDGSLEEESALAVASAIDAEHAQEADYAGVADKADKLTTARTIALSEGVVSASISFDGSKNISIPVRELSDLHLKRTYNNNGRADTLSLADLSSAKFASNRLAFNNPDGVLIYKSNDGGATWTDYGATNAQKINFISGITERIYIGGKTAGQVANQDRLRIILTRNRNAYTTIEEFLILLNTNGANSCKVKLSYLKCSEYNANVDYNAQTYTELTTKQVTGWSGWNRLLQPHNGAFGASSPDNVEAFVLEFWFESYANGYENNTEFAIYEIIGIGKTVFNNNTGCSMINNGHLYTYDHDKNATFPANITCKKANAQNINAINYLTAHGGIAIGTNTTAIGTSSEANGFCTTAIGYKAKATGYYTTAIGTVVEASNTYQTVFGKHNATSNHAFVIGWGTADAKKNIFSVDTSGNVYGTKFITSGGTNQQVVLGNGDLKNISDITGGIIEMVNDHSDAISDLDTEISGIKPTVETHTTQIGTLTTKVSNLENATSDLPEFIDQVDATTTKVNEIDGRVTALENAPSGGEDARYTQFANAVSGSVNPYGALVTEDFFANAEWNNADEDGLCSLSFYNSPHYWNDGEQWAYADNGFASSLTIPLATSTTDGVMSKEDKAKLDSVGTLICTYNESAQGNPLSDILDTLSAYCYPLKGSYKIEVHNNNGFIYGVFDVFATGKIKDDGSKTVYVKAMIDITAFDDIDGLYYGHIFGYIDVESDQAGSFSLSAMEDPSWTYER